MSLLQQCSRKLRLPPLLLRFWLWTVALTLLSLLYTETMIHLVHSRSTLGPLVLFNADRWWDFLVFQPRFQHFRTPAFWNDFDYPFTYPPAMALVFAALYKIPHALRLYLLTCIAALIAWAVWLARALAARGSAFLPAFAFALTIPALAWPVWLLLGSANTEGIVALILAAALFAVIHERWWLAAILIALAAALKLFPLALLALLLSRRRYKEFIAALLLTAALTLASLAVLGPTVAQAWHHTLTGLDFVRRTYALDPRPQSLDINHSLFSPIKFAALALHAPSLDTAFNLYVTLISVAAIALYFLRIRHLPILNQILALTTCAILLPPYSVDYTLIQLFVPLGLLCLYVAEQLHEVRPIRSLTLCFASFAFLFPIGTFFTAGVRYASQVRMAALVLLLVAVLRTPFPWPRLDPQEAAGEPA